MTTPTSTTRPPDDTAAAAEKSILRSRLLRASAVERELPDSSMATVLAWVRSFLAKPHPEVGRPGPVCPFVPMALTLDTIWVTSIDESDSDPTRMAAIIGEYRDMFGSIEPCDSTAAINKTILVVFPHVSGAAAATIDDVKEEMKASFILRGLMLGEFHPANNSGGLRNPDFRPLRSPVPMLAIRHMVETDLPFLMRPLDAPEKRALYLRGYLRRMGNNLKPQHFETAITALVIAESQLAATVASNAANGVSESAASPAVAQLTESDRVAVVGGGLAGSLMALSLAQQGIGVDVYERRADPRKAGVAAGRSINLGLSKRGIQGLTQAGLIDEVMPLTVVMRGRTIHSPDGGTNFQPYGKNTDEVLHSIDRNELNRLLLNHAERYPQVRLHFNHELTQVDKDLRELEFGAGGSTIRVKPRWVLGADGAYSRVRQQMQRGVAADYHQEFLEWGYKELTLAALPDGHSAIDLTSLHVWPRVHGLFVSHPNRDGSHTLTLFLPMEGPDSFATTRTPGEIHALFDTYFPDLVPLLPNLVEDWNTHSVGTLITTRTAPWSHEDWIVLVGDACHAVYPFYGQGMNSAFEDCCNLQAALAKHGNDRAAGFAEYESGRRTHTDALAELSKQNFVELKQKVKSPWFRARKRLDAVLNRLMPRKWLPLYTMIAHTTLPYGEAMTRARRQDRILTIGLVTAAVLVVVEAMVLITR